MKENKLYLRFCSGAGAYITGEVAIEQEDKRTLMIADQAYLTIDEKECTSADLKHTDSLCREQKTTSIIGLWITNTLRIDTIENAQKGYIVTRQEIPYKLIKTTEKTKIKIYQKA